MNNTAIFVNPTRHNITLFFGRLLFIATFIALVYLGTSSKEVIISERTSLEFSNDSTWNRTNGWNFVNFK